MCGLVGFITKKAGYDNKIANEKSKFMMNGLFLSSFRGVDGTGMGIVRDIEKPAIVVKRAISPADFLQINYVGRYLQNLDNSVACLGHTRSATKGFITDDNAHPFQYGHITLIHNGHAMGCYKWKKGSDSDVDSAQVAYGIYEEGAKAVMEQLTGDFCFVWHDSKDGTVNIAKNKGRPLYWAEIPSWGGFVFMSEVGALGYILSRNGIRIKDQFWFPKDNSIYTFKVTDKEVTYEESPFSHIDTRTRASPNTISMAGPNKTNLTGNTDSTTQTPLYSSLIDKALEYAKRRNSKAGMGCPTSRKAIQKAVNKLNQKGFKFGELYGATAKAFALYKNQVKLGCVYLEMQGLQHKGVLAEIHGVKNAAFKKLVKEERCLVIARAINIKHYGKQWAVLLELDQAYLDFDLEDENSPAKLAVGQDDTDGETVDIDIPSFIGPEGVLFNAEDWEELTSEGCAFCGGYVNPEFHEKVLWVGEMKDQPICHVCADSKECKDQLPILQH